ncbi:MAG: Rrf2 family transcriptional regulator [Candidatus Neomarinimicrobiota bacterium]
MLKLTRKAEYALMAMRHMRSSDPGNVSSAKEISERYHLPHPLLAKIMQELAKKRILKPFQGARGGYMLETDVENMSLREFFERLEGPLGIMDCHFDSNCSVLENCNIRSPIERINVSMRNMLDNMTVYDITR